MLRSARPAGPRTPQPPSTARPMPGQPGTFQGPSKPNPPLTHAVWPSSAPQALHESSTLVRDLATPTSFPVGPWQVSLSTCHPNLKSVTPPGPHYAQGCGFFTQVQPSLRDLLCVSGSLSRTLGPEKEHNRASLGIKVMLGDCPEKQDATLRRACAPD